MNRGLCRSYQMPSGSRPKIYRPPRFEKELESQAWRWLSENGKLGVSDLVREGRWADALMFLNFVTSSYSHLTGGSVLMVREYIPPSSASTPRGKQSIIEAMISCQLNVYKRLYLDEFLDLPIEECLNPLAAAAKIVAAATGGSTEEFPLDEGTEAMDPQDAWKLLQSLFTRVNGTRNSIRKIRDWAYRLSSCARESLLLCAADFRGRVRRSMVPVIITIFYTAVKSALKKSEGMAWSTLQEIVSRMSAALRNQMCAYILSYRKLGYFQVYNLGPTRCSLNDNYLRVCNNLLNEMPEFLWHDLYQSLTEKYKASMERRKNFLVRPSSFSTSATMSLTISNERESDDF